MNQTQSSASPDSAAIAASCRLPLMLLFVSGAVWLVIASFFAMVASLKFHSPHLLADTAWLTYGRVRPAYTNSLIYGFCVQTDLGMAMWMFTHLGRTVLAQRWLVTIGGIFWNLGVTIGVVEILAGNSTGFELLEMPGQVAFMMFLGYLMMSTWLTLTLHRRKERNFYVSQWFVLAALFWFPWIYSTANLLLQRYPVRGMMQAVIAWWYSGNLTVVWLGLTGSAAILYAVPKLLERELHSRYLALMTFWMLMLFGSWCGIPNSAPLPAWMAAVSTVATGLVVVPTLALGLNVWQTLKENAVGNESSKGRAGFGLPLRFILVGTVAFVFAGICNAVASIAAVSQITDLTWFTVARSHLYCYGFFVMVMFGAVYRIVPQLTGMEFPSVKLIKGHFWLATFGLVLVAAPLAIGGILQGLKLQNSSVAFIDISKLTMPFLRASTTGDLFIALGHILFLINVVGLVNRFAREQAEAALAEATRDIYTAEAKA